VTRVKICGITNLDDAERAASLDAWAVGLIFYSPSPRHCPLDAAERIAAALRRRTEVCGVFVNDKLDRVVDLADRVGLTMLQLHGDEGPAYCAEARRRTGLKVTKARGISGRFDLSALEAYHTDFHLLDARTDSLRGGTGETFDWSLVAQRRSPEPAILSGGLRPDNVADAIEIARPFAVDVASGVEAEPGRKDPERLEAFFAAVRGAPAGAVAAK
jgi:phosphoribosylanthranilate isomerase